jgi:hypothetical protein
MSKNTSINIVILISLLFITSAFSKTVNRERKVFIFIVDGVTNNALSHQMENGNANAIKAIGNHGIFRTGHVSATGNLGADSYPSVSGLG